MSTAAAKQRTAWNEKFQARLRQEANEKERRLRNLYRWENEHGFSQSISEEIDDLEYELARIEESITCA